MNAKVNISNRAGASFPVRRMDFEFGEVPRYWAANDAGLTHFMTTLSALFPEGEQFFVDSTRAVRKHPKLSDPDLQREISAFIGQEAMHSKEHLAFNSSAQSYGYDIRTMEQQTGKVIRTGTKVLTTLLKPFGVTKEMIDLTGTCALEHFTAVIAAELLQNKDVQAMFNDSTMHQLWMWHAVEENEHKAVVFDVYTAIYGHGLKAYTMRAIAMIIAMGLIFMTQSYFTAQLMKIDGKLTWKDSKYMLKFMYARKGFMTRQISELLDFFRPNFHPNDSDTDQLLADWKLKLGL
ncbi:metal-dependent hydrolase [Acinetobacter sp. TTH0-4]|uniref:metal-dependent hydrolase n=1 Tax=Acinetobacter sp. TTH0-4 TaxID=1646498 RepID=UPI0006AE653B|nr:metal-dependent hydrolase [Acinetobacter sp. TTH0-4]ALD02910.1 metal-dependent hydrolase [Acinetobacter sp. TTH0-4]